LTSSLAGDEWSVSRSDLFNLSEKNRYPLHRRLNGPRVGMDAEDKRKNITAPYWELNPGPPDRSLVSLK